MEGQVNKQKKKVTEDTIKIQKEWEKPLNRECDSEAQHNAVQSRFTTAPSEKTAP